MRMRANSKMLISNKMDYRKDTVIIVYRHQEQTWFFPCSDNTAAKLITVRCV